MAWGQVIGQAVALGSKFLSKKKEPYTGEDPEGYNTSGWTNSQDGFTPGTPPPTQEPLGNAKRSKWKRAYKGTNNFIGSELGSVAKGVGGQFLSDYRSRRNTRKQFEYLEGKGLTPYEIAGAGGGRAEPAQANTLGNGPARQAASQQAFQADQAQKQRDHEIQKAQITTAPAASQAESAKMRIRIEQALGEARAQVLFREADKLDEQIKGMRRENQYFWQILGAKMGPENLKMALALHLNGLDIEAILKLIPMTDEQAYATQKAWRDVHNNDSIFYRNIAALQNLISKRRTGADENVMGRFRYK